MSDDLKQRLAALDPILETHYDTQRSVEQDPYGATQAIEQALFLLRDQADRIEQLIQERDDAWKRAGHSEKKWGETEIKLAKAVEALRVSLEGFNWAKAYLSTGGIDSMEVDHADATVYAVLAELGERK